jgi:hypothetical protein
VIRGRFERVGSPTPPAELDTQQVRVTVVIEDAHGFVHHYDDIVTTSQAATDALKTLAHVRAKTVVT